MNTIPRRYAICSIALFFLCMCISSVHAVSFFTDSYQIATSVRQGAVDHAVMRLEVSANSFNRIYIQNTGTIQFGVHAVKRVALYKDDGNNIYSAGDTLYGQKSITDEGPINSIYFNTTPAAVPGVYWITYDIASEVTANETTEVEVDKCRDTTSNSLDDPTAGSSITITILPSLLGYNSSLFSNINPAVSDTSFANAPGQTKVPVVRCVFKAPTVPITLTSVTFQNSFETFSSIGSPEAGIKKMYLYVDTNDNLYFDGPSIDTLVGTRICGSTGDTLKQSKITLSSPQIIPADDTKAFFVFYDIGNTFPVNSYAEAALINATGLDSLSNPVTLEGPLPVSFNAQFQVKNASVVLAGITENISEYFPGVPDLHMIQGEINETMLTFRLHNTTGTSKSGISFKFFNPRGTFSNYGDGISKVLLYQKDGANPDMLVGTVSSFPDPGEAVIANVTIPSNQYIDYYVIGDLALRSSIGTLYSIQLKSLSGISFTYAGDTKVPRDVTDRRVSISHLQIISVTSNITNITPANTNIPITILLRNVGTEDVPLIPGTTIREIRPVFYSDNVNKADISYEYSIVSPSFILPTGLLEPGKSLAISGEVSAANAKTKGVIQLDAYVDYKDPKAPNATRVILDRCKGSDGMYHTAATTRADRLLLSGVSTVTYPNKIPEFIASMNIYPYGNPPATPVFFFTGDVIAPSSRLFIHFISTYEINSLIVYLNGSTLSSTDYNYNSSSHGLDIYNLGSSSGLVLLKVNEQSVTLSYVIESGMVVGQVLSYPSPYSSKNGGNLYFSFQCSDAGYNAGVAVYDSSGDSVWKKENITTRQGYNEITWDGITEMGNKIGTGMYLVHIYVKSGSVIKTTKTKFGVY